jgi:hypothetical protein
VLQRHVLLAACLGMAMRKELPRSAS